MGFLLHPVRTLLLIAAAFASGMIYEKHEAGQRCTTAGGQIVNGVCK